jgi:hypothetical protein
MSLGSQRRFVGRIVIAADSLHRPDGLPAIVRVECRETLQFVSVDDVAVAEATDQDDRREQAKE